MRLCATVSLCYVNNRCDRSYCCLINWWLNCVLGFFIANTRAVCGWNQAHWDLAKIKSKAALWHRTKCPQSRWFWTIHGAKFRHRAARQRLKTCGHNTQAWRYGLLKANCRHFITSKSIPTHLDLCLINYLIILPNLLASKHNSYGECCIQ